MRVKSILINSNGETIGAKIIRDDGIELKLRNSDILNAKEQFGLAFENAIIDINGFVRAKNGNLPKELMQYVTKKKHSIKNNEEYIIMLKDTNVCKINRHTGIVTIYNESLLPFDIYLEYDEYADTQNNTVVFNWWCAHRLLSLDREHAKAILNSCGLKQATTDKDRADIALRYKCLSLKDFYWVKKIEDTSKWEEVNLFDNSLSNAVIDIALNGKSLTITNKHLIASDLSTDGLFAKAWCRKDNTFYLYKGDKNNSVTKEIRASKILQQVGFKVLDYNETTFDNTRVAMSKCFTSKGIGYVTAGDMNQNYDIDTSYYEYSIMNLCDYLVGNSDRHQDNWGYLFNDKREIIGFAPIFDFNHAFEASENSICLPEQLLGRNITMFNIAKEIVNKYNIKLKTLSETDEYTEFVNRRIKLLNT